MAQNEKSGSDLDIFEDLGKKAPSVPPPNGARSVPPPPPPAAGRRFPWTASARFSGSPPRRPMPMPTSPSRSPPPPPGRGSLPPVVAPPARRTSSIPPPPPASSPSPRTPTRVPRVDMDWDEEDEATHIFDETSESTTIFDDEANQATKIGDPIPALAAAPPSAPLRKAKMTLLGLSAPPAPSQPLRRFSRPTLAGSISRPPPPPARVGRDRPRPRLVGLPGRLRAFRRLPRSTRSRPRWRRRRASATRRTRARCRPPGRRRTSRCRSSRFPAPRRCRTSCPARAARWKRPRWSVRRRTAPCSSRRSASRASSRSPARCFLPSHPGRIVINVADAKGGAVNHVEIFVDGRKQCDTAPCIVDQVAAGPHEVKVLADGYDAPAVQTVTVESRKDATGGLHARFVGRHGHQGRRHAAGREALRRRQGDRARCRRSSATSRRATTSSRSPAPSATSRSRSTSPSSATRSRTSARSRSRCSRARPRSASARPGARVFLVSGADRRELPMLPISVDIDTAKTLGARGEQGRATSTTAQSISFDDGQAERDLHRHARSARPARHARPRPAVQPAAAPSPAPAPAPRRRRSRPPPPTAAAARGEGGEAFLNINSIPPSTCFLDGKSLGSTPQGARHGQARVAHGEVRQRRRRPDEDHLGHRRRRRDEARGREARTSELLPTRRIENRARGSVSSS